MEGNLLSSQPDYIRLKWSICKVLQYLLLGQEGNHITLATRLTQGLSWQIILSCFLFCQVGEIKCCYTGEPPQRGMPLELLWMCSSGQRRSPAEPGAVGYMPVNPGYTTPSAACSLHREYSCLWAAMGQLVDDVGCVVVHLGCCRSRLSAGWGGSPLLGRCLGWQELRKQAVLHCSSVHGRVCCREWGVNTCCMLAKLISKGRNIVLCGLRLSVEGGQYVMFSAVS